MDGKLADQAFQVLATFTLTFTVRHDSRITNLSALKSLSTNIYPDTGSLGHHLGGKTEKSVNACFSSYLGRYPGGTSGAVLKDGRQHGAVREGAGPFLTL